MTYEEQLALVQDAKRLFVQLQQVTNAESTQILMAMIHVTHEELSFFLQEHGHNCESVEEVMRMYTESNHVVNQEYMKLLSKDKKYES